MNNQHEVVCLALRCLSKANRFQISARAAYAFSAVCARSQSHDAIFCRAGSVTHHECDGVSLDGGITESGVAQWRSGVRVDE